MDRFSLAGKTALLTFPGNAYGENAATGLAKAGARLILAGDAAGMEKAAAAVKAAGGSVFAMIEYTQGTEAAADALAKKVQDIAGAPDIFVENGGKSALDGWNASFEDIYEDFTRTQTGLMLSVRYIGTLMAEAKKGGSVIFLTDYTALVGADVHNCDAAPEMFDRCFSSTQAFISGSYVNYARQAAGYLGEHGIRCNAIAFAPMERDCAAGFAERFKQRSHIARMLEPSDVEDAVVFFASDASAYMTGLTVPVDGGYTAK